jgi:RNA polymerase sigma-70 factor (ECF subfamily)
MILVVDNAAWPWSLLAVAGRPLAAARDGVEDALARQAARGDRRAFDEIYRRHVDLAHRRLSRLIGPDPEREDLLQMIFVEAFRSLPSFRGEASFSTWFYRIIANVAYDHLRRRRRAGVPLTEEHLAALVGGDPSPEAALHQRRELARVMGFVARLKPKKRIAFVLRTVEGLSLEEIAVIVGATSATVGQRVKHAQREINVMLARDERRRGGQ